MEEKYFLRTSQLGRVYFSVNLFQDETNHDIEYDKVHAVGSNEFWINPFTIEADQRAINSWENINDFKGTLFREASIQVFYRAIILKKNIAVDLYLESHGYGTFDGTRGSIRERGEIINKLGGHQKIYELWRNENMTQDSNGIWIRKTDE